ncbi:DUF6950 family protein [Methylobacterium indicum]|uniref:DUF6950 family protein n=1 Tax=Methylobacterium indicum TaxID=1775910 RepID=UPI000653DAEC|nr:hypothetical protein [Methylobacterium indicum]
MAHIMAEAAEPFRRPDHDCVGFVCSWLLKAVGIDPGAHLRSYSGLAAAERIIRAHGGFLPLWASCMASAGFRETAAPRLGDVGVVIDAAGQEVAAIRARNAWAGKSAAGVQIENFPMLAAWSLARG